MSDVNTGYKLIALGAVFFALYSCNSSNSQRAESTSAQFERIQAQLAVLQSGVATLQQDVVGLQGCSTARFLAGECAPDELPNEVAVSTTYCISQGRSLELSGKFSVESASEFSLGVEWPIGPKLGAQGKLNAPLFIPILLPPPLPGLPPPVLPGPPLPSELAVGGETHLGKGLDICVDVPIVPTADQQLLIADLVRGVNLSQGSEARYQRRTDRLLDYAAIRTPIATPRGGGPLASSLEEAIDAFDVVDEAADRFMANGFQPVSSAGGVFSDPIFADLATALDLPPQLAATIQDPQRVFESLRNVTTADACPALQIDSVLRARFPQIHTFCQRIEALPSEQLILQMADTVQLVRQRVTSLPTLNQMLSGICAVTPLC